VITEYAEARSMFGRTIPSDGAIEMLSRSINIAGMQCDAVTIQREANMTPGISESVFSWLSLVGATVPPRDPNDDEDEEEEEDGGNADDEPRAGHY
jgi:hypothetical protein